MPETYSKSEMNRLSCQLKPCKICGAHAKLSKYEGDRGDFWRVFCNKDLHTRPNPVVLEFYQSKEYAIKYWQWSN